ncbi:hypothetical protein vseg_011841 [Gypsophila vaccaria]
MKFELEFVHFLIIFTTILSYALVEGTDKKFVFEEEQNLDLQKQLNTLNKPPIKTFEKNGEIIDCIDIYKQPAFDHPLLKNHKLQMRPTTIPKPTKPISKKLRSRTQSRNEVESCPHGSVPMKRVQKDDLLRAKDLLNQRHYPRFDSLTALPRSDTHFAMVSTPTDGSGPQFLGAKTTISVYNSSQDYRIEAPQLTQSLLWIGSAINGPYSSIEYGWTVNPSLYGDTEPRTYSLWTADGLQNTGCFNAMCPGYVQISGKRIMGEINKPDSVFGETVYAMEFQIFRDQKTSNWWLLENLGDEKNEPVGYWPKELFPDLKDFAKVIQLGGKVYSPSSMPKLPPMGSGVFVEDDFTRTCYASNIKFVNPNFEYYVPKDVRMLEAADIPNTYKAKYLGDVTKDHPQRGYTFLFGGPYIR